MTEKNNKVRNAREVFELAQSMFLEKKDLNSYADLFASDGALELPFSPHKSKRFIQGRENIRAYLAEVAKASFTSLRPTGFKSMTIYETIDPEVIIAEWDMRGEVEVTRQPFQLRYLQIFKVHNGEIVTLRDYWNPLGTSEILGRLPELFARLTQK